MSLHFLLKAKARTLSPYQVAQMSEERAVDLFRLLRWGGAEKFPWCCPPLGGCSIRMTIWWTWCFPRSRTCLGAMPAARQSWMPELDARNRVQGIIGQRQDECLAWLDAAGKAGVPWLALDDYEEYFWPGCERLYRVNHETGLTEEDVEAVVDRLRGRR